MDDRKILITGADSTARVIAERFAKDGANVFVCDIREEAVDSIIKANTAIAGIQADIGNARDVERLAEAAFSHLGHVDFLINVVGIAGPTAPVEAVTDEDWSAVIAANLSGMFYTARAVIPSMKERRFGGIVNFSSGSTRTLLPDRTPYIVSKYGVEGLTRNLARELGPHNIRANAILPGGINNDRLNMIFDRLATERGKTVDQVREESLKYISMRTLIEPGEIADMVEFLCSGKGRHISGQLIGVCGNVEWES